MAVMIQRPPVVRLISARSRVIFFKYSNKTLDVEKGFAYGPREIQKFGLCGLAVKRIIWEPDALHISFANSN